MLRVVYLSVQIPHNCSVPAPQIVQFVHVATESGGPEARSPIVDACDTLLNLLIKVQLHRLWRSSCIIFHLFISSFIYNC